MELFILKRLFDIAVSFLGLLILSPVILFIAWQVKRKLGSPVFFRQVRPSKNGKPFEMIKFRTMLDAYDEKGNLLPNDQRFTKFGNFLRSTSLDELPELWNVLKGDMSLVGPRPLLMEYLPLYNEHQLRRNEVFPGITGWAQVNGRNAISWEQKFDYDVWYLDNRTFILDIKILLMTVKKVFLREGISNSETVVMPKFSGSKKKTLAILGASGHGKVLADIAELTGWEEIVFYDDAWPKIEKNGAWRVVGDTNKLIEIFSEYDGVIVAIGNNKIRSEKTEYLKNIGANLATLVHPSAVLSKYSSIGIGSVVVAGAVVNPYCKIGDGVIINTCSSVGHDCNLGNYVHICPGARLAGGSNIEELCWIGLGSSVRQLINIGARTIVGAGSVVVKDIPSNATAFGVPAKIQAV